MLSYSSIVIPLVTLHPVSPCNRTRIIEIIWPTCRQLPASKYDKLALFRTLQDEHNANQSSPLHSELFCVIPVDYIKARSITFTGRRFITITVDVIPVAAHLRATSISILGDFQCGPHYIFKSWFPTILLQ